MDSVNDLHERIIFRFFGELQDRNMVDTTDDEVVDDLHDSWVEILEEELQD